MKTATTILSDEHQNILIVINALETECNAIKEGKEIDKEFFAKAIDFIRNYADKFHHAKEEDILFKEMCKDTVEMHCNPTDQMRHEHEIGRNFVKGMEEGINKGNKDKIVKNAQGYAGLLKEHIMKEDQILYPMADEALDNKTKDNMLKQFKKVETEKFGAEQIKKLLNIVKEFSKRK